MAHDLHPKYLARLAQLEHLHPPGYFFLNQVARQGPTHELRLSTHANAHVYRDRAYLLRIELEGRAREPTNIVLSPRPHLRIENGATDRADLLFPKLLTSLVMEHGGFTAGWAPRGTAPDIELRPSTPNAFFEALFDRLCQLDTKV